MKPIKLTAKAKKDLVNIWRYTNEKWGLDKADTYLNKIDSGIEDIKSHPEVGRSREDIYLNCRSMSIGNHFIVYRIKSDFIEILRVLHKKMDVPVRFKGAH